MPKPENPTTCVSCGAPVARDAQQCSLCGWPVGEEDHDLRDDEAAENDSVESLADVGEGGPFCHMCGWKNPAGARFCSSCGTRLLEVKHKEKGTSRKPARKSPKKDSAPVVESAPADAPERVTAWHIGMLFAAGILIVGALYLITAFSKRAFPPVGETSQQQVAAQESAARGLPANVEQQLAQLQADADAMSGDARVDKQREMVELLSQSDRPDRAADIQQSIAEASGNAADWFEAGHLFYAWMDSQSGELRFAAAQRAADAYEKGLELGGDDLNIRTFLAMAYLNTRSPMLGVQQIRGVLEKDPDHLQGNYYYGVMLTQINRIDQAVMQFERVKELAGADSPFYQQADVMLQNIRSLGRSPGS